MPRGTQVPSRSHLVFAYGALTLSRRPSQAVRLTRRFLTPRRCSSASGWSSNPTCDRGLPTIRSHSFGLVRVRSPLLTESLRFPLLRVLRCFSSPGSLHTPYAFRCRSPDMTQMGLPHSDIHGSKLAGSSPWLFAAIHVLHRSLVPRHPPCALPSSTARSSQTPEPTGSTFSIATPPLSVGVTSHF